jgi:GTP:adenosylcobinamide-phosphate guanylyltransferase
MLHCSGRGAICFLLLKRQLRTMARPGTGITNPGLNVDSRKSSGSNARICCYRPIYQRRLNSPMGRSDQFSALVLAGSRGPEDPVAREAGVACKAVVPVAGRPMVVRVVSALGASDAVADVTIVGLPEACARDPAVRIGLAEAEADTVSGAESPSASVALALSTMAPDKRVLVTTADHALLRAEIVDAFLSAAAASNADVAIGLVRYDLVTAACPGTRRTVTRFQDGGYCGTNLFAFLTERGREAVGFWSDLERHRKHPWRIMRSLGPMTLLRYVTGRLSLDHAMKRLSVLTGVRVEAVLLPFGEAAVDVDKPEDLILAESLAGRWTTH